MSPKLLLTSAKAHAVGPLNNTAGQENRSSRAQDGFWNISERKSLFKNEHSRSIVIRGHVSTGIFELSKALNDVGYKALVVRSDDIPDRLIPANIQLCPFGGPCHSDLINGKLDRLIENMERYAHTLGYDFIATDLPFKQARYVYQRHISHFSDFSARSLLGRGPCSVKRLNCFQPLSVRSNELAPDIFISDVEPWKTIIGK
jgi:hypothetical protein